MFESVQQWWHRRDLGDSALADYLGAPLPARTADARTVEYLAVDLETTGLDPASDALVSIGTVPIVNRRVRCRDAQHLFVHVDGSVGESATIHHIRDADLGDDAHDERDALRILLKTLKGRVLLVHHAPVDLGFLKAACQRQFGAPLVARVVDTLDLAKRRRERGGRSIQDGELRLNALRAAHGLPRYPAHDALTDALATAELFLAMLPHWSGDRPLPLKTILR